MRGSEVRRIAPARYIAGERTLEQLTDVVTELGSHPLLVHGDIGIRNAQAIAGPLLPLAPRVVHEGYCTEAQIASVARRAGDHSVDVVVAIGGGRVMDVAKAAASVVGARMVAVPTSPATCAAMTPLSVIYREDGVWQRGLPLPSCPEAVVLDHVVLTSAPRRLLSSGVLDALAKVHEVRMSLNRTNHSMPAAAAARSLCDALDRAIEYATLEHTLLEVTASELAALAEAAIAFPGWIGGFAGESSKLAAAHAVHNALTNVVGSKQALHGELVGFGLVVQDVLAGRDPNATINLIILLGAPRGLTALGCESYLRSEEVRHVVDGAIGRAPAFRKAFPLTELGAIQIAMLKADRLLTSSAAASA